MKYLIMPQKCNVYMIYILSEKNSLDKIDKSFFVSLRLEMDTTHVRFAKNLATSLLLSESYKGTLSVLHT